MTPKPTKQRDARVLPADLEIIEDGKTLRSALAKRGRIGFVPTMGNIHAGHIQLVKQARLVSDTVVASVFVNRLQFGPNEDFDKYPRTLEADLEKLNEAGVDFVFVPSEEEMYPTQQTCFVDPGPIGDLLEGQFRPGFFRGVATVVTKLFNLVQPDVAVFGKKDYQQLRVIEHVVRQLSLPVQVVASETTRDLDGLALSSRNSYLTPQQRAKAPRLYDVLKQLARRLDGTARPARAHEDSVMQALQKEGFGMDYVAIRQRHNLESVHVPVGELVILIAARLGETRLIDNLEIILESTELFF